MNISPPALARSGWVVYPLSESRVTVVTLRPRRAVKAWLPSPPQAALQTLARWPGPATVTAGGGPPGRTRATGPQ